MPGRPRILYLSAHCPTTRTYGAQLRTLHIGRLLQRIGDVSLVIASIGDWSEDEIAATRRIFDLVRVVRCVPTPVAGPVERLRHELAPGYLNTHWIGVGDEDAAEVRRLAAAHDVTWIFSLRVANSFRVRTWDRSVVDIDDVPSRFHAEEARHSTGFARLAARRKEWIWRRRESTILDRFDVAVTCSAEDRAYLGGDPRIHVVPNGFDAPNAAPRSTARPNRVGFIGALSYEPNLQGLRWFVERAWPALRRAVPDAELRVIGAGSDAPSAPRAAGVTGLGWVDDPAAEMATWSASIVPILVGGGTRVKIAEAFARRIPVIATSLGVFGYDVRPGRELLVADSPEDFAAACVRVLTEPDLAPALTESARRLFDAQYSWDAIAPAVDGAVGACLAGNGRERSSRR
jgi:glycosyltransferase involved in cell wall biosynthesis